MLSFSKWKNLHHFTPLYNIKVFLTTIKAIANIIINNLYFLLDLKLIFRKSVPYGGGKWM